MTLTQNVLDMEFIPNIYSCIIRLGMHLYIYVDTLSLALALAPSCATLMGYVHITPKSPEDVSESTGFFPFFVEMGSTSMQLKTQKRWGPKNEPAEISRKDWMPKRIINPLAGSQQPNLRVPILMETKGNSKKKTWNKKKTCNSWNLSILSLNFWQAVSFFFGTSRWKSGSQTAAAKRMIMASPTVSVSLAVSSHWRPSCFVWKLCIKGL